MGLPTLPNRELNEKSCNYHGQCLELDSLCLPLGTSIRVIIMMFVFVLPDEI